MKISIAILLVLQSLVGSMALAQTVDLWATGTGRTTGHIADLKIKNTTDTPINIVPQTVYIPSSGQYQPYVAEIPGTTVPPHETVIIPVSGYCADVHKPPVGTGDGMPPIDTWITTTPAPTSRPSGIDYPVVTNVVPPFTPQHIPEIVTTPGFTPNPPPKTTPVSTPIIPTWPGTDFPVNGTIDPAGYPETFAPAIIDALEKITVAFDKLKGEGTINTPFSVDLVKEMESVIQQTFWIFMAEITGEKYKKESFQEKVIEQFENSTGTTVATLPEPEKKKLDGGVDAFWNVFVGEIAIDIVLQKGKGTFKKLGEYLKDKTKDMAKDAVKEFIKEEMKRLGKEWEGKSDEEAEKSMDELIKDIKKGDTGEEEESGEEFLNDWLAEMMVEGDGFDPAEKIEGDLLDKIDSPIDWSPIKTNTYAIGEGSLDVYVEGDHGVAKAASGVRYKREGLEDAKDAEKGGGIVCDAGMASQTTSGSITLKTIGKTGSWAGATGEGIISTGHGIAIATLESFNGMFVIAICECPDETSYETYSSITAYSVEENTTGIWVSMFDRLMNEVVDQLDTDIANAANASKNLSKENKAKVQKGLENAAKEAAQYILPCTAQGK